MPSKAQTERSFWIRRLPWTLPLYAHRRIREDKKEESGLDPVEVPDVVEVVVQAQKEDGMRIEDFHQLNMMAWYKSSSFELQPNEL
jgi:hypothetical protein